MLIVEKSNEFGLFYEVTDSSGLKRIVQTKSIISTDLENQLYVFYDSKMKLLFEYTSFLYYEQNYMSENSIIIARSALKLLNCFCEIFNCNLHAMTTVHARMLVSFLKGVHSKIGGYELQELTNRSNSTVNFYLKSIRKFLNMLNIKDNPLLRKSNYYTRASVYSSSNNEKFVFSTNSRVDDTIPLYISAYEYKNICEIIDRKYTSREKIIVRLMYEHGLRIGEVLGLTIEDLQISYNKSFDQEFVIKIRNRLSDKRWQCAKSVLKIKSNDVYTRKEYYSVNSGYHLVKISNSLGVLLVEYINMAHASIRKNEIVRYNRYAKADSVEKASKADNYYIFLNTIKRPLSPSVWNKTLRKICLEANLVVDDNVRINNLNHRFRHGYAMILSNNTNLTEYDIMRALRHRSILSQSVYQNPTSDDIAKMYKEINAAVLEYING